MHDFAIDALHAAVRGLSARQRVHTDNIANLETPRFLAGRVDFEDSLRDAIENGRLADTEISNRRSLAPTLPNGNNVDLNEESLALVDTELRYQLATTALNSKFKVLRTSIGGQ